LIHLAWGGLPNYRSPAHTQSELPRHIAFLDRCLDAGLPRLAVAGTCLEYGMASGELDESMPAEATTHYGQAKNLLHAHLCERREQAGFGLGWLRLFYLHGPGQAPNSLFSQLQAAVAAGATDFDMSQGDQVRDFLPVALAAEHLASIALRHANPGTVNICSGSPVTVVNAVEAWLRDAGAAIRLNRGVLARPDYEPFAFWGSAGRLTSLLENATA
jgi:dTDP-6-deoxy-L-talose 4-dehydrogenase (NAD+)